MIYSDRFVWLHFPKCAGTKVTRIFREYYADVKSIHQDRVIPFLNRSAIWHDSIQKREQRDSSFVLGDRVVICSFRRLPSWLKSRYNFEMRRNPNADHHPELLLEGKFLEASGFLNHADHYVKNYLPESLFLSNEVRFIRTEYFTKDFKKVFSDFVDISIIPETEFSKKVNTSTDFIPDVIKEKLLLEQESLYSKCPRWKAKEDLAYA